MFDQSLDGVLGEFFADISPNEVHAELHQMREQIALGGLGMLPRRELAERAYLAGQYAALVTAVWQALIATWGDDPNDWQLPPQLRRAVGNLLALQFSRQQHDHTTESSVPVLRRATRVRGRRRGRSGT